MPISAIDGCSASHWQDVLQIHETAIREAGFDPALVSDADDSGIIHKRIIQNLYENPIVVCDVSAKNPNVMFELGIRLAFDKPTIITKDDHTSYIFDTQSIEHLEYPRDLRFTNIKFFQAKLSNKIRATYDKSKNDKSYTTFLGNFGQFKLPIIDQKEVSADEYIIDELKNLQQLIYRLMREQNPRRYDDQQSYEFEKFNDKLKQSGMKGPYISDSFSNVFSTDELCELKDELSVIPGIEKLELELSKDKSQIFLAVEIDPEHFDHKRYLATIHSEKFHSRLFP